MKKNVASQVVGAQMVSASDGSAFTGSVTCYVTGDGGTQAAGSVGSGACTHEGNGFHTYAPAQAETNYDHVAFTFIGSGAVPATIQIYTSFPQTGDSFARLGAPAGASLAADVAAVKSDSAAILVDTAEIGAAGAGLTALASAADLATVDSNVDAIKAKTDNLPSDPADASDIAAAFSSLSGQVSTVDSVVDAIKVTTDKLDGMVENTSDGWIWTVAALQNAPSSGGGGPTAADIADAVWEEALSDHSSTSGSTAEALAAAGGAGDPWITPLPGSYTSGQAGYIVGNALDAAISTRATQTSVDDLPTNSELATALDPLPTAAENATAVWAAGTRTLTALDEDATTLDLDSTIRGAVGLGSADLDNQLDAIPTATENADALLDRNMATGTDSGSSTVRTPRQALRILRNKWTIDSDGLQTITKEDDSTPSWTQQLTSDGSAQPVVGTDPAGP